jgi:hypothetical protein
LSFFQPQDWQAHWCGPDWDLGSASPVLLSPSLMFMSGKYGQGFLLDPTNLGGTNGQLFPAKAPYAGVDVCVGNNADATFGSFAYAAPRVYLECENHGIVSLTVNAGAPSFSSCDASCAATGTWQAGGTMTFGPPIAAGGAVWAVDIGGSGLYGFDAATGAQIYHSGAFGVNHFSTPSEAGGQIFVSAGTEVRSFNMTFGCTSVGVNASPSSPSLAGTPVTITGTAAGCINPNPSYEFWILNPGSGTWQLARAYSTTATYNWSTAGLPNGTYRFSVWAKDSASTSSYDAFNANTYYTLTSQPCASVGVSAAPSSPAMIGTAVTITGAASGCSTPSYEFWILYPGSGTWQLARAYSTSATYSWVTTGLAAGTYRFSVWARDATSSASYDAWNASQYFTLTPGCSSVSVLSSPPGTASAGTPVTITGTASGCLNASPLYEFWILLPGSGTWQLAQAYSTSPTYPWATTGLAPGTYRFSVWAKDSSSTASYDAWNAGTYYTITAVACSAVGVSSSPPGTAAVGTTVTVTGSATCPNANPLYEFWVLAPGATSWQLAAPYSTSATLMWTTTGKARGTYRFSVWVHDSSNSGIYSNSLGSYDAYNASLFYTLT